jgi:hypothetical protein
MSNTFQKLLNQAKIKLAGQSVFQPFELPAELIDYSPELLKRIAMQISAYGFPYIADDLLLRVIYLPGKKSLIRVSATIPPGPTVFSIGNLINPCHYLFLQTGLIQWEKAISVQEIDEASLTLDKNMTDRGLMNPRTGDREKLLLLEGKFRVAEVFPTRNTVYRLDPKWKIENIKSRFDSPERLTTIANRHQGIFLVLRGYAEDNIGNHITAPPGLTMKEIHARIDAQYQQGRYS